MTSTFGGLLTGFRIRRGWSQSALGVEAGYDSSYVTRLEAGKRVPSRDTVGALAAVLDLAPHDAHRLYVSAGLLPPGVWLAGATMLRLLEGHPGQLAAANCRGPLEAAP